MEKKWKLVGLYPVKRYTCGLVAGQKVRLLKDLVIKDSVGRATGRVFKGGEVWEVMPASDDREIIVWLRRSDGERQTWDDSNSIYEYFEVA